MQKCRTWPEEPWTAGRDACNSCPWQLVDMECVLAGKWHSLTCSLEKITCQHDGWLKATRDWRRGVHFGGCRDRPPHLAAPGQRRTQEGMDINSVEVATFLCQAPQATGATDTVIIS